MQFRVAPQADGAGEPDAVRDHEATAAHFRKFFESLLEGLRAKGFAVSNSTEVRKDYLIGGD